MPRIYDEPFADSSQIPTFLVSRLARSSVTVALSGDGGDELFGGYNRYFWGKRLERLFRWIPEPLRRTSVRAARGRSGRAAALAVATVQPFLPARLRVATPADKMMKLAEILSVDSADAMYRRLVAHWKQPEDIIRDIDAAPRNPAFDRAAPSVSTMIEKMMLWDSLTYLPDDILVKVDRATMAVSLEGRAPLLDARVIELAWSLPLRMKIRDGAGKWILRRVLARYIPESMFERPKMGFGVPLGEWLRGPLRDWAEDLLSERSLREEGFFHPGPIRLRWEEHRSGRRSWHHYLWDILMFQAWVREQRRSWPPADRIDSIPVSLAGGTP
jgi:asparagine synthase (glutamine-hydrolysing)